MASRSIQEDKNKLGKVMNFIHINSHSTLQLLWVKLKFLLLQNCEILTFALICMVTCWR